MKTVRTDQEEGKEEEQEQERALIAKTCKSDNKKERKSHTYVPTKGIKGTLPTDIIYNSFPN